MSQETSHTVQTEAIEAFESEVDECDLVVIEGPDAGKVVAIGEDTTVGTDEQCDLVLEDDRVSGRHLHVSADGQTFDVRDLDSKNGVVYQGSLVSRATVSPGATLRVGRTYLRIQPRPQSADIRPSQRRRFGDLVAESLAMREVFAIMELAADSDVHVLMTGETGTGKQLAAQAIHRAGPRQQQPFVTVDCGALPDQLIESELFGHVEGAYTGATGDRQGAFRRADGGTVFLDELDSMPADLQARLLRVCEEQIVRPVGADEERAVDVRIIGAGHDLRKAVADGDFRADLFYRLSVIHIVMPPLRERLEDLAPITRELLQRRGFPDPEVAGPNFDRLRAHRWPGNVRELRNVIERAIALSPTAETFRELNVTLRAERPDDSLGVRTDLPFKQAKGELIGAFERRYLRDLFARCDGNISETARQAELDRKYLRKLLDKHDLL